MIVVIKNLLKIQKNRKAKNCSSLKKQVNPIKKSQKVKIYLSLELQKLDQIF